AIFATPISRHSERLSKKPLVNSMFIPSKALSGGQILNAAFQLFFNSVFQPKNSPLLYRRKCLRRKWAECRHERPSKYLITRAGQSAITALIFRHRPPQWPTSLGRFRALTLSEATMADQGSPRRFARIDRLPPYVFNFTAELKIAVRRRGEDFTDSS